MATAEYRLSYPGVVSSWVEDRSGKLIATLAEGKDETISGTLTWAGRGERGELVSDGLYYIKLATAGKVWQNADQVAVSVEVDNVAPQSPQLLEPSSALTTNRPEVALTSQAAAGAMVRAYLNGNVALQGTADARGVWRVKVTGLQPGENQLYLTEADQAGNESAPSRVLAVNYDDQAPASQLTVSNGEFNPASGTEVSFYLAQTLEVYVTVTDGKGRSLGEILPAAAREGEVNFHWQGDVAEAVLPDGTYRLELHGGSLLGKCTVVIDSAPPAKPQLLLPGEKVSSGAVQFVWEGAGEISRYQLKIWQDQNVFTYELFATSLQVPEPLRVGNWSWQVEAFDGAGNAAVSEVKSLLVELDLPQFLELTNLAGGPNPFAPNGNGRFERFQLLYSLSQPATVRINIFNLAGKEVYKAEGIPQGAGDHIFSWDGRDRSGRLVRPGLYLIAILAENQQNKAPARGRILVSVMY